MQKNRPYDRESATAIRAQAAHDVDRAYTNLRKKFHGTYEEQNAVTKKVACGVVLMLVAQSNVSSDEQTSCEEKVVGKN